MCVYSQTESGVDESINGVKVLIGKATFEGAPNVSYLLL